MASIEANLTADYTVALSSDTGHRWTADEPQALGGDDLGPNPYELLLGSLAACTCITVSMFCRRKGWSLTSITARYTHDRVHAKDCEDCDDERSGYLDRVTSQITIDGDLDEAQRRRLTQVAESCPVHKTLAKGIHLVDDITFG